MSHYFFTIYNSLPIEWQFVSYMSDGFLLTLYFIHLLFSQHNIFIVFLVQRWPNCCKFEVWKWLLCLKVMIMNFTAILHYLPVLHFTVMIHARIAYWLLNFNIFTNYINGCSQCCSKVLQPYPHTVLTITELAL
jgi:hypothetical protein